MRGVYCGDVQGRERLLAMHSLPAGQVLDRNGGASRIDVQRVSGAHVLGCREQRADQLYMQQGVHGARWRECDGVHRGDLQGREWLSCLHAVLTRQVQYSHGGDLRVNMQRVSGAHVLGCREQRADQLYMQQGVHGAGWGGMRGVCCGDVQGREWHSTVRLVLAGEVLDSHRQDLRVTCSACPAHTYSGAGSSVLTNCTCNKGYTGPDGVECEACVAGTYKTVNGTALCDLCSQGKYSTATGMSSESTCSACPAHTYSGAGSSVLTNCTCNKGYTGPDGVECEACVAGTYKEVNGSSPCTLCSQGKYSTETGEHFESTCSACPAHTYSGAGSSVLTNCTCNKGYTGPDGATCTACITGSYKDVNGSTACTLCSRGKYSTATAGISESTCSACPAHTYSGAGSSVLTNCTCNKGYTGPDGVECEACVAGTYKDGEWHSTVRLVLAGEVLDSHRHELRVNMQRVSGAHVLGCREQHADQLYMQQGVHGGGWGGMHVVCSRQLQGREWISCLHYVLTRQVQHSRCSDINVHLRSVSCRRLFWPGKPAADQLYMQQRVHWSGRVCM